MSEITLSNRATGLLLLRLATSRRKVVAGLRGAATGHPVYGDDILELGAALDAIDMLVADVWSSIDADAAPLTTMLMTPSIDTDAIAKRIIARASELMRQETK